jgi:hypothetical protein
VKLLEVKRRQESCQAEKSAEGDDVDEVEGPAVFFPKTAEMLSEALVLHVRRFLRQENHHA